MEEQEIRLRDLVEIVWRGRLPIIIITSLAVILTLIYSIVVQKPLFEGVVRVNTTQFNYPVYDLVDETAQSNLWVQFLSEVEGIPDPVAAAGRVRIEPLVYTEKVAGENQTVEIEKADLVEVRFCYPDAVLAGEAANHIGEELLKYTKERRLEILHDKKEELTKGLEMLDEKLAKIPRCLCSGHTPGWRFRCPLRRLRYRGQHECASGGTGSFIPKTGCEKRRRHIGSQCRQSGDRQAGKQ